MTKQATKPSGAIRLLTANLYADRAHPEKFSELLEALAVDIACLQELGAQQAREIARVLPHGLLEPSATPGDHRGMGIAARRPLSVRRLALPRRDGRLALLAPREWPELEATLELVNVHIQAPHLFPQWRSLALRSEQLASLLPHLDAAPDGPRVLCGDFNATPLWPVYRALAARLPDLALTHARLRGGAPAATWGPWPGAPRLLRIDHVLGSGVLAASVRVLPLEGGDHSALVVDLVRQR